MEGLVIEKKARKPLSEDSLEKLAEARKLANQKRKEMAEQRKADKEKLVQQKNHNSFFKCIKSTVLIVSSTPKKKKK